MSFGTLSEVRDRLNPQWYRSKLPPERFRELSKRNDAKGWTLAGGHLALLVVTGAAVFLTWAQGLWLLFVLALFVHGTIASFFRGTAVHELGHGTVFAKKWLNDMFLYVFSMIGWWNPFDYAASHTYHHRYTLHPEGDGEVLLPLHPAVGPFFLVQMFTINLSTQPERTFGKGGVITAIWMTINEAMGKTTAADIPANHWLDALHEDQPAQHRKSVQWSRAQLGIHALVLMAALWTGYWVLPLIVTVPSFIANWLSYFLGLTQHCGLRSEVMDFRKNTRSIRVPKIVAFLYWHMNWHIEHHMYAGIPCYNLPALADEIKDDLPQPRTLWGAWREMLQTWEKQKIDPSYAYDTPFPATARTARDGQRAEEASIGELAPKGLA